MRRQMNPRPNERAWHAKESSGSATNQGVANAIKTPVQNAVGVQQSSVPPAAAGGGAATTQDEGTRPSYCLTVYLRRQADNAEVGAAGRVKSGDLGHRMRPAHCTWENKYIVSTCMPEIGLGFELPLHIYTYRGNISCTCIYTGQAGAR